MWFRSIVDSANSFAAGPSHRSKKRRPRRRRAAARLRLEGLETRCLLSFSAPVDYPASTDPNSVVVADFANNGVQDLVVANSQAGTVSVLAGKGDGTFGPPTAFATGPDPVSVAVGDLTGNGKLDIVTGNAAGSVSVLLGNGDGTFQPATTFDLPGAFPPHYTGTTPLTQRVSSIAVGDMNHDGRLDLVVAADALVSPTEYLGSGAVDVLLGNGSGGFSVASTTLFNFGQPTSVLLADFGNGNLDVAVPSPSGVSVLLGNGDGTLGTPTAYVADINNSVYSPGNDLAVGDVNGDGKLDLVTVGGDGNAAGVSVLLGNGDGTFQAAKNTALPPASYGNLEPLALVLGDLNGDGKLDVAVTAAYDYGGPYGGYGGPGGNLNVLLGNGDGSFAAAQTIPGVFADSLTATDFNGDRYPDLAVPNFEYGDVHVLMNEANWSTTPPTATSFAVSGFASSTTAGTPGTFTVTALNPDGTVATGYTGTVRFSSSDGQAALPTAYAFTAADAGKHTFSATLKTAGTQSITATDASTGTLTGSETGITVTAAAASHFALSAPASNMAGNSFSITVTALDPYNNTATGYAGTVHFTSSDAKAVLPANYTFTSTDAGKHTFSATLKTAGTQSISATDTMTVNLHGTDSGITVKPAVASKFVISAPSSVMPGQSFSLTVTVEDAYGNIVTGYTGTIHFTSSDKQARLPANYTFTAGNDGVHTFTGLVLKKGGHQTITLMDTRNSSITGKTLVDVV